MRGPIFVSVGFLIVVLFLTGCQSSGSTTTTETTTNQALTDLRNQLPPRRPELNGTVKKIVGNIYTLEVVDMSNISGSGEDMQAMREKMQTMSETERMAYFQKMQEEREKAPRKDVEVLIPVGIPISIVSGRGGFGGPGGAGGGMRPGGGGGGGGRMPAGPGGAGGGVAGTLTNRSATTQPVAEAKMGTIADIKIDATLTIRIQTGTSDRTIAEWVNVQS